MPFTELLDSKRSILVIIDEQGKLMEMVHRPQLVIEATLRLLHLADMFEVPVVLTEQYPQGLGPTHARVLEAFNALETPHKYLDKLAFGCCGDAGFEPALVEMLPGVDPARRQVVIAGIETHVCVIQTVLPLLATGNSVHLCWEAVSGRGEEHRKWALKRMLQAGAVVTNIESVGFEWARSKEHPKFKEMSNLYKVGQLT
ncbi:MAG: isochorismatase family protein [bacterium]|nr:isochorismatase family protein [bacterium]